MSDDLNNLYIYIRGDFGCNHLNKIINKISMTKEEIFKEIKKFCRESFSYFIGI